MSNTANGAELIRVLWITSHADTLNSVRPEAELALGLARAGVRMHIMTQADSPYAEAFQAAGIKLTDFVPRRKFDRAGAAFIREYCRAESIELLHLFNNKAIGTGLIAARRLPVNIVSYRGQTGNVHRWDPISRLTHLNPRIDRVVCVSKATRDDLARYRDPASVVAIYKGHDLAWYEAQPARLHELGVPPGAFAVAVVANYRPRKGIEYVVDAAQWLPPEAPIHILLVGSGHENRSVLERISRSPYRENFHLLGHRKDAPAITAACSASVLAATKREGLPKTVIESMAYGVPPVVTSVGGAPELVVHGESGLVVRPRNAAEIGEALRWLYEHPAERVRMGQAARARIGREFHISRTIEAHLALYRELCGRPRA
jgi:L-malate glycosyltransferase